MKAAEDRLAVLERGQRDILDLLNTLIAQRAVKDWYTVEEVANTVGRSEWQVREWLRTGRVQGVKRPVGRGRHKEWAVSHEELERYRNHGLRPVNPEVN